MASMQIMINQLTMLEAGLYDSYEGMAMILKGKREGEARRKIGKESRKRRKDRAGSIIINIGLYEDALKRQLKWTHGGNDRPFPLCG